MNIGVIGGTGVMGHVILRGLLSCDIPQANIVFSGIEAKAIRKTQKEFSLDSMDTEILVQESEVLFVCVKPQDFKTWKPFSSPQKRKIVVSIMAGISTNNVQKIFPKSVVIRAMPNLGGQIGESMTAWFTKSKVTKGDVKKIELYLSSFGKIIRVKKEDDINSFAALIGSGPAYFFYLARAIQEQAQQFGFSKKDTDIMVRQLLSGVASYAQFSDCSFQELIQQVASKKGMTEAALQVLQKKKVGEIYKQAIQASYQRGRELSL